MRVDKKDRTGKPLIIIIREQGEVLKAFFERAMNPKVSVVTSTYNRADVISRAINSVLAQTFENWEMCIVGDCTPDHTEKVVNSFQDERI
ncbi:MAG: glycosyltransferase, partial [Kiritimatiellae bacterium]|nr:glycosyltransferase [Kiritimatiellia bacterium]